MNMSRRVRVLSVTKSTGGLAHYNTRLCARLDPACFDVHVVCLSEDNATYAAALAAQGIAATPMAMDRYRINPASDLRLAWRLLQHVRRARYDVIVGHGAKAGFLVRLVGRLTGAPAIYTLHSTPFLERVQGRKAALYRPLERFAARLGGHVVTITHAMRDELVRCRIVAPDRVTVIHTGIVLSDFDAPPPHAVACAALGLDPARPVVGWAGRFVPQKAPLDFVRAAARVADAAPEVQFFMAGDGPLVDAARAEVARLGLNGQAVIAPWQADVPAMLAAFDVYALTSHWEGLPQSLLEAMALRRAPVATGVDGTAEVIRDGVEGYLVGAGDVEALAARTLALVKDVALRARIGQAARARVEACFTAERMIDAWTRLLLAIAGRGGDGR